MRTVRCFFLGKEFPAISITGSECAIGCPHCMGQPLKGMLSAKTPDRLIEIANELDSKKSIGLLLSGGCDLDGVLPIGRFVDAIRRIKDSTNLRINIHPGFPRSSDSVLLASLGVDAFSINYPLTDEIAYRYMGIRNGSARFRETVESLRNNGARRVIPHVLIGLGEPDEELRGLKELREFSPSSIVFIAFFPLRGTPLSSKMPVPPERIYDTVMSAREIFPTSNLVLGCMRPKGYHEMEIALISEALDGIVMPSKKAISTRYPGITIEKFKGCCSLYL